MSTKKLKQEYEIAAPLSSVWKALTDTKVINKWGGGPAKMKPEVGFKFSFWGGDITGSNTKVISMKQLNQDWMAGKWDEFSKVVFKLSNKAGVTTVVLTQTGIPFKEFKDIADGWDRYYFGEIKKLLESKL
jgi:activator of HSP90 ATPase